MGEDDNKRLAPKLRFPQFRGRTGWARKILGEEGEFLSSLTGKSAEHFGVGSAKYITYMNVFTNTFTDMSSLGTVDVGEGESQNAVVSGDVLFTVSSETPQEVGMSSVVLQDVHNCYLNSFCTMFRFSVEKRPNPHFVGYMMRQSLVRQYLSERAQGSTRFNLSRAAFRAIPLALPSEQEQQKVADCLRALDEVIVAQGKKVEAFRLLKKGVVQQLFPRVGEALPRLRLQEFRRNKGWRIEKISSLLSKVAIPVCVDLEGSYSEIGIRSHGKGIFHKKPVTGKTLGNKRVFRVVKDAFVLNIVFAWEQAVATSSEREEGMIASHRFPMYVPRPGKCDVRYVKEFFLTKRGKHLLELASPGGAGRNKTLGQNEFEKLEIAVPPTVAEQRMIADCLSSAGDVIDTETGKLNALKAQKRGLMQQLFPSSDAIDA
jgi:type I restriction enzyme, S subunit